MSVALRYYNLPLPTHPGFYEKVTRIYLDQKSRLLRFECKQKSYDQVCQVVPKSPELVETSFDTTKNQISDSSEIRFDKNDKKRYWTEKEKIAFEKIVKFFNYTSPKGMNNCLIAAFVKTRTTAQVRSHAQKFFLKKNQVLIEPTEDDVQKIKNLLKSAKFAKRGMSIKNLD
ncbi:hypothetical protein EIN_224050 [Entamoeba invadens IP1]|uniref:HTH myb-type domain-containing protein n=1 Tax=Entamoeba invadens IP1 TaxID=370355 RepID=A0A0A1U288_ENTIV|nr:hypothetical protein EIN_224050 [Entamoeba invadens IP1]ELP88172.1 hypothetical protein EIN_224050 [Entamoeba invadens IP1]|eukprot:XP_004254943.1 hypothetical protein EIN_224050 [Entamoeba invadens IP1]